MLLIRKKALRGCKVFYLDFCKDTLSAADVWGVLGASSAFLGAASLPCARRLLFCARYQPLYERIVSFTRFPSCAQGLLPFVRTSLLRALSASLRVSFP